MPDTQIPRTLTTLLDEADQAVGLDIAVLAPGDRLKLRAGNATYRIELRDPRSRRGIISSDGGRLPGRDEGIVMGATLSGTGSLLKIGWVLFDYGLVLLCSGRETVTAPVEVVTLNDKPVLPLRRPQ